MEFLDASKSQELDQSLNLISIPQLSPNLEDPDQYSFRAVVTLVWPFSSSNRSFSLLLAEPDFRLRNQNGQIRVTFWGLCAEEVARAKVGIGDAVLLSLQGAQWTKHQNLQSTPGKFLSWELQFKYRVKLEATRNGKEIASLDIDRPPSPKKDVFTSEPTTPATSAETSLSQGKWETPTFLPMKRVFSHSTLRSDFNLFAEEDGSLPGIGRKRPRFSFPSSGWRLVDEPDDFSEERMKNDDIWFESDEDKLDRDEEEQDEEESYEDAATEPVHEPEPPDVAGSDISPVENISEDDIQLLESGMQVKDIKNTCSNGDAIQIIQSSEGKTTGSSLQNTRLSSEAPHVNSLVSPDPPTSQPMASPPAESLDKSLDILQGPSVHVPPSQSQLVNSTYTNILDHNTRSIMASNVLNMGFPDGSEVGDMQSLHDPHKDHEFSEQHYTAVVSVEDSDNQISSDQRDYPGQDTGDSLKKIAKMAEEAFGEQQNVDERAIEDDKLASMQEAEQDEADYLTYTHQFERRRGNFIPNLEAEKGTEATSERFEFEDSIDEENSINSEEIEVEDLTHDRYSSGSQEVEDEGFLESRHLSDDAEGDYDDGMSEQSENQVEPETEDGDEVYTESSESEMPQRTVYPEVIVIDSDSEDEPSMPNVRSSFQERETFNGSQAFSEIEEDDHQCLDHMDEVKGEYIDEENEDKKDGDIMHHESDVHECGDFDGKGLPVSDAYISDEETHYIDDDTQVNENYEREIHTNDKGEVFIEQRKAQNSNKLSKVEQENDNMHLGMERNHLTSDVAFVSKFDKEQRNPREQRQSGPLDPEEIPRGDDDISVKDSGSPILDELHGQEHLQGPTRHIRPLVYRTVSPMPVPTPPSTLDDEPQYKQPEFTVGYQGSLPSSSKIIQLSTVSDKRYHRWTDGSDDESPESFDRQLPVEEGLPHSITEHDDGTTEKLDEVVLVEDHSLRPRVTVEPEMVIFEELDQQDKSSAASLPTPNSKVYPTLATLSGWLNKIITIISVVVDIPFTEHATYLPEKHRMRLRVTDMSMAGVTIDVDIIQPIGMSLPTVAEGDAILLHNFEVRNLDNSIMLLSSNNCDWTVFSPTSNEPQISHLTASFGESEQAYVKKLQSWYREDGAAMAAGHMLQMSISQEEMRSSPFSAASSDAGSFESSKSGPALRARPRQREGCRRVTIHELRDGRRYTEIGSFGSDSVHELRDGTVYAHPFARDD